MTHKKCYEYLDHTADMGIRGFGKTFLEAVINVARGMVAVIHKPEQVVPREERAIEVTAATLEDLVVQFLNQLLYLHDTERFIPKEYQLELIPNVFGIQGIIRGEIFNPKKHTIYDEVKAVTYHQLLVEQKDDEWMIQVICDL